MERHTLAFDLFRLHTLSIDCLAQHIPLQVLDISFISESMFGDQISKAWAIKFTSCVPAYL